MVEEQNLREDSLTPLLFQFSAQHLSLSCANDNLTASGNFSITVQAGSAMYVPAVLPAPYVNKYSEHCLQDSDGNYYMPKLQDAGDKKPNPCDECTLLMFREHIRSSIIYDDRMMEQYARVSSRCESPRTKSSNTSEALTLSYEHMERLYCSFLWPS
jgi:hypothetical protein